MPTEDNIKVRVPIYPRANEVTLNNRMYTEECLDEAFKDFKKNCIDKGRAMVVLGTPKSSSIDLNAVAGIVENIEKDDNQYFVNIEIKEQFPMATAVKLMIESGKAECFPIGAGSTDLENGVHKIKKDYRLYGFSVGCKEKQNAN